MPAKIVDALHHQIEQCHGVDHGVGHLPSPGNFCVQVSSLVLVMPDHYYCELFNLLVLGLGFLRDESFLYCRKLKVPVWDPDSRVDPEKENIFTQLNI